MVHFVGIDVGGTFTDCVAVGEDGVIFHAKSLSTKADPIDGMVNGLTALAADMGLSLEGLLANTSRLAHGTTIGTNLVVERNGAKVALLCSRGHGDSILMMRGTGGFAGKSPDQIFSPRTSRPPVPIVPKSHIFEIDERVDRGGRIVRPLNVAALRPALTEWLQRHQVQSVAVSLLWAIRNPSHEQAIQALLKEINPALFISLSSAVSPRLGEFERTVATVINAYVGPLSSKYLTQLDARMRLGGLRAPLLIMQSNGGVVDVGQASAKPLTLIDSGPTGGLAGAAALARAAGHSHVIATDMGGTSFDVGLIVDGDPIIADERVIGQYTYFLPHLDVRSIACGGGSIATSNPHTRTIVVGPASAGSEPGPACYGRGGRFATVTDADVVLGLIRPDAFLGGKMKLNKEAARAVIEPIAMDTGLSVEEAAAGILTINNSNAALLIRERTLEQGYDPRDFIVYAFGGAGAVHAFGFADELGVQSVLVPLGNGASTLSAYGIAAADTIRYFESECSLHSPFDAAELEAAIKQAERVALESIGASETSSEIVRSVLMRYAGQQYQSLAVTIPSGPISTTVAETVLRDFESEYERLYGAGAKIVFQAAEVFAVRIKVVGDRGFTPKEAPPVTKQLKVRVLDHQVFWPAEKRWITTTVYDGETMGRGDIVRGPALVELPHTTVAVAGGQSLHLDEFGNLVLRLATDQEAQ
jgi:N-methylhydantoinase A